jgi:hypothetical protein
MSSKDTGITSQRPAPQPNVAPPPVEKEPETMPANTVDPIDSATLLWGLRLWFLCALIIVMFGLASYLLNWYVR